MTADEIERLPVGTPLRRSVAHASFGDQSLTLGLEAVTLGSEQRGELVEVISEMGTQYFVHPRRLYLP